MTRDDALKSEFLDGKNVLFNGDKSHGIPILDGLLLDGTVVSVSEERREAYVCFGFGHQSFTDPIKFYNLVAIADRAGKQMKIGRFSGRFIDLRVQAAA